MTEQPDNPAAYHRWFHGEDKKITDQDIAAIQSLDLRNESVRKALSGFLARAIHETTHQQFYIGPQVIERTIDAFVAAMKYVPQAAEMINARAEPEK